MKRKFSLVMSAAMILSIIAPMTNALAEDIQTPETASTETIVAADTASGGTTYYVDSTIGDDSNSGTSPETPWKTLDKVTATTFLPGDTILLKSGSIWNGEWLWPKGSGTEYTTISTYSGTIGTSKTISLPETTSSKFKVLITGLQEDTTKNSKGQTDPSIQEIELYYR